LLDPKTSVLTLDTISEFAARARALGVERFVGAATSAVRDARDGGTSSVRYVSGPACNSGSYLAARKRCSPISR